MSVRKEVTIQEGQFEDVLSLAFAPVVALSELIKNASDACVKKNDVIRVDIDTKNNQIEIKDNGSGFSASDIEDLSFVGHSEKMSNDNNLSAIGEPFAGSKGLGILTAFNLCNLLEIETYSSKENKAYQILWEKGTGTIVYDNIDESFIGTKLILHEISDDNIKLLTMNDELSKFFMSSINYYIDSDALPFIEIYEDGIQKTIKSEYKIDTLYNKYRVKKGNKGAFVAKASFKYSKDILTLSYEDNILNMYTFSDENIDLNDINSLTSFLKSKKISISRYREYFNDLKEYNSNLDDFEGNYYIWRDRKNDDMSYPNGIRIYVNNYGLYSYLNRDNDWLMHSEITQNKKASNYKLKNTYGYVNFKNYNESSSHLKISKERNDFIVNIPQKKFMDIMKKFVSNIFSDIDINIKNYRDDDKYTFSIKREKRNIKFGEQLNIKELLKTNLLVDELSITYDEDNCSIDEDGNINFAKHGEYDFTFGYEDDTLSSKVIVADPKPDFLVLESKKVHENNNFDLTKLIRKNSLKNIETSDIQISSDDADVKEFEFTVRNSPGKYNIDYKFEDNTHSVYRTSIIEVIPKNSNEANKIRKLFPEYRELQEYDKIIELIDGMAECHMRQPTLAMIGLRSLLEVLLKIFFDEFDSNVDFDENDIVRQRLEGFFKVALKPGQVNNLVIDKYKSKFTSNKRKNVVNYYVNNLDLNSFVHNPLFTATPEEFKKGLKKFQDLINFIIEALVAKK